MTVSRRALGLFIALGLFVALPASASADTIAYQVPAGTVGNQTFAGPLGMDFDVATPIVVSQLGVFDSGSDGLARTITVRLYDRDTQLALATLVFPAGQTGTLVGGSRFLPLSTPLTLPAGFHGTIVADGYGDGEPNGNYGAPDCACTWTTDSGGGAIVFVGGGRYGQVPGTFPPTPDGGPVNRYAAGTFVFAPLNSTSTSVSCSPSSVQVGSQTNCTATVTDTGSTPSTPTGTVSFTSSNSSGMFTAPGSCTLSGSGASASCSLQYNPVTGGSQTITATYGGDGSHSGSSGTTTVVSYQSFTGGNASCNGFYAGSAQNVTVPSGANCTLLPGTTISQDVTVQPGGSLSCQGASIGHDLQAQKPVGITVNSCQIGHDLQVQGITGASAAGGDNYVCSSSIGHDVQIQNGAASASPFDIGDPPSCSSGNQVGHDLVVQNNAEPVDVSDNGTAANPIGHDLTVQNNKPGGATVSNNHAGHDATCQQNSPQAGAGNSAQHNNSCPA